MHMSLKTNSSNERTHLYCLTKHDSFHSKLPITKQLIAVNYTASMMPFSSDDSGDEGQWKICDMRTGEAMARGQECKVLNCGTQEGTANSPTRNPNAAT